jgi:hypothetical protein
MCENQIVEYLKNTYNAMMIRQIKDKKIVHALYNIGKKYGNQTVITRLISNYFNKKIPAPAYLEGPYALAHMYSPEYDINIYLLGEFHFYDFDCPKKRGVMPVETYLKRLVETTPTFLDIYMEVPALYEGKFTSSFDENESVRSMKLPKMANIFRDCFETVSRKSDLCQTTRLHYVDVRTVGEYSSIKNTSGINLVSKLIPALQQYLGSTEDVKVKAIRSGELVFVLNFIKKMATAKQEGYVAFWLNEIKTNARTAKQLARSYISERLTAAIERVMQDRCLENRQIFEELYRFIESDEMNDYPIDKFDKIVSDLHRCVIAINTIVLDAYTMGRVFKEFKMAVNQPSRPKNVVVYTGANHTRMYVDILQQLGFETYHDKTSFPQKHVSCIDMSGTVPIFKQVPEGRRKIFQ